MPDNTVLSANVGTGDTVRDFNDTGNVKWPAAVACYVTGGSAGAWALQHVTASLGLPVAVVGTVPVSGTFWQATQPVSIAATVTVDTELPAAAALSDATANPTAPMVGAAVMVYDGSQWLRPRGDTANGLDVDVTRVSGNVTVVQATGTNLHAVIDSGTVTTVSTVTSLTQFNGNAISTNSGNKDAGTLRVVIATDQPALTNALTVLPGNTANTTPWLVTNHEQADKVYIDGTSYTVKRAKISAASSGENTLVAAVSAKKIRVLSLCVIAAGAVNAYFNNATDGGIFADSTNKLTLSAGGDGFVLPHNPYGWMQTGTNNEALRLNLSGAVAVAGGLTYIEV